MKGVYMYITGVWACEFTAYFRPFYSDASVLTEKSILDMPHIKKSGKPGVREVLGKIRSKLQGKCTVMM